MLHILNYYKRILDLWSKEASPPYTNSERCFLPCGWNTGLSMWFVVKLQTYFVFSSLYPFVAMDVRSHDEMRVQSRQLLTQAAWIVWFYCVALVAAGDGSRASTVICAGRCFAPACLAGAVSGSISALVEVTLNAQSWERVAFAADGAGQVIGHATPLAVAATLW